MKDKVEISDSYITKFNTSQFSHGLEWVTELLSINHNREIRVYSWYSEKSHQKLLIPKAYEINSQYIKIEKIQGEENVNIDINELIPNLKEFIFLGKNKKMNIFDFLSSPTQSVIRGLIRNATFLGTKIIFQSIKHLFLLYYFKPKSIDNFLIHKDLKKDQNMMQTKSGVYFIDFGSSILTKYYFLTDIVELATDHQENRVNLNLIKKFIRELNQTDFNDKFLSSQIFLLLLRRYLHFPPIDRANKQKMSKAKIFLENLNSLMINFKV